MNQPLTISETTVRSHLAENYAFASKERDTETGLSYFGARYYSSELSIWLSVDPMSGNYPSTSPYAYCRNNSIILYDPNGMFDDWVEDKNGHVYWDENATSQETAKEGETYLGKSGQRTAGNDVWNYNSDGTHDEQKPVIISGHEGYDAKLSNNTPLHNNEKRLNDISFGTAIESGIISGACKSTNSTSASASELEYGQRLFKFGGKVASGMGKLMGGIGVVYTFSQALKDGRLTYGEGIRLGIQTTSLITSFVPGCGTAISLGLSAADFFLGDKIEKIGSNY